MTLIAGINAYNHNASVTLIDDGRIVYAAEEERFNRVKYSDALPRQSLENGLASIGADARDVGAIGFCWDWRLGVRPRIKALMQRCWDPVAMYYLAGLDRRSRVRDIQQLPRALKKHGLSRAGFHALPHHLCHAATAFYASPFEQAAILGVDGVGEWETTWMGYGEGFKINRIRGLQFPDSLGLAYDAITQLLGFHKRNDAGKVMGLAAYGDPGRYRDLLQRWIRLREHGGFSIDRDYITWHRYFGYGPVPLYSARMEHELGPRRKPEEPMETRHADIAAALQARFEEVMVHMARHLQRKTGMKSLGLAGGCALNCLANQRIATESGFERVFVFPAASDPGAGTGAALLLAARLDGKRAALETVYLGNASNAEDGRRALMAAGCHPVQPENLAGHVAGLLAAGAVVGWVQGRMEFGPRALGNRSLLADPRSATMKERLNNKVKRRELFRPFAPVCPAGFAAEWFTGTLPSPWMMFAANVRPEKRHQLGAVTHADGSARLQTVAREENPLFHDLLIHFGEITGVPVLVNTSFNLAGQPVVATAEDAVECYMATAMDALVIGPYVAVKPDSLLHGSTPDNH